MCPVLYSAWRMQFGFLIYVEYVLHLEESLFISDMIFCLSTGASLTWHVADDSEVYCVVVNSFFVANARWSSFVLFVVIFLPHLTKKCCLFFIIWDKSVVTFTSLHVDLLTLVSSLGHQLHQYICRGLPMTRRTVKRITVRLTTLTLIPYSLEGFFNMI